MFVYAVLALVQKGNTTQSPCSEIVIILSGCCDRAGGGWRLLHRAVKATHFVEVHSGMKTNRFPYSEIQLKGNVLWCVS